MRNKDLEDISQLRRLSRAALGGVKAAMAEQIIPHAYTRNGTPVESDPDVHPDLPHRKNPQSRPTSRMQQRDTNRISTSRPSSPSKRPSSPTRKPPFNTSPRITKNDNQQATRPKSVRPSILRSPSPIFQFHSERLNYNVDTALTRDDTYYAEMQEFRTLHADLFINGDEARRSPSKQAKSQTFETSRKDSVYIQSTCLDTNAYTSGFFAVNDRLYPEKASHSPFFGVEGLGADDEPPVKVSIPLSKLRDQSKTYKPHRRNSFDAADSLDIGKHLHKGYETSGMLSNKSTFSDTRLSLRDHLKKQK
ncbi:hypothetical protein BJ741DRAFT_609239 [Chytriomyces cf. hyalinus JEL632]|nr:hypothetical protein BJ741DRAFT_609239 [Chytriomyces cf. hyalinus JEL632]